MQDSAPWLSLLDPAVCLGWIFQRRALYALAWLAASLAGGVALVYAWTWRNMPARADGNDGHLLVDFGGQYLAARMVATGQGRHLFDRNALRAEARKVFPASDQAPDQEVSDVDGLMGFLVGRDDPEAPALVGSCAAVLATQGPLETLTIVRAGQVVWNERRLRQAVESPLGGALYPPVHGTLFAPLALLRPQACYRVVQVANLVLIFVAGWLVSQLSEGRVWWPIATVVLMLSPGFAGGINLGQNPILSAVLLLGGYLAMVRGRPGLGGFLWGCLAFKPVWAVAFLPALPFLGRWRAAFAMAVTGLVLVLLTLPFVGLEGWLDWQRVGQLASRLYDQDENWTFLSRDLLGIPRRYLLTFHDREAVDPDNALARWLGRSLWLGSMAATAVLAVAQRQRVKQDTGVGPAFVLLGAWLSCFHFMYYDVLLAALPVVLLFTRPEEYLRVRFWGVRAEEVPPRVLDYYRPSLGPPPLPLWPGGRAPRWVVNPFPPTALGLLLGLHYLGPVMDTTWHFPPFDTFTLLALWGWCGWRLAGKAEAP